MPTFETYTQLRQAEDVQDEIYNISPIDNPVASMSRTIQAQGKIHEWTEDELKPAGYNAKVEGAEAGDDESQPVVERQNYCQIMDKVAKISGTLEEVDKYGRDSEMAYQLELRYGELANDEEKAIIGEVNPGGGAIRQVASPGDATTPRTFSGFYTQMASTAPGQVIDAAAATTYDDLEGFIIQAHKACYDAGGNPGYAVTDTTSADHFAWFARSSGRNRDIRNDRTLINVIDLYVSTYGELDVVLDRQAAMPTNGNCIYGIDFNYTATPVLRPTRDWPLAKGGDYERRQILRECTFALLNSRAHFVVENVPTSLTL